MSSEIFLCFGFCNSRLQIRWYSFPRRSWWVGFTSCFVESSLARSLHFFELLFFRQFYSFVSRVLTRSAGSLEQTSLRACSSKLYRCRLFASRFRCLRPLILELLLPPRRYISSSLYIFFCSGGNNNNDNNNCLQMMLLSLDAKALLNMICSIVILVRLILLGSSLTVARQLHQI